MLRRKSYSVPSVLELGNPLGLGKGYVQRIKRCEHPRGSQSGVRKAAITTRIIKGG
jgi:hypothetical protein